MESRYADRRFLFTYDLRLQDGSDLPGWMEWNVEYMTLSGVAPCIDGTDGLGTQKEYDIRMIGSLPPPDDAISAAQSFTLIVASHSFEYVQTRLEPGALTLNLTTGGERIGQPLTFGGFAGVSGVFFDGEPVDDELIGNIRVKADCASLEPAEGLAPRLLVVSRLQHDDTVLPLTLTTTYGERLNLPLNLSFQDSFFRYSAAAGWLNDMILVIGQAFNISLQHNTTTEIKRIQAEQLLVEDVPSWMNLHLEPLGISGAVPPDAANQTLIHLVLHHTDPETFAVSKARWNITLLSPGPPSKVGDDPDDGPGHGLPPKVLIPILVFAILVGLGLLVVAGIFIRKMRRARKIESGKWGELLLLDRRDTNKSGSLTPSAFVPNLKDRASTVTRDDIVERPAPAYHQHLHVQRSSSPSKFKSLLGSAITPTKTARRIAQNIKDRSKRYTKSFMSYPMDYLESTLHPMHSIERNTPPWGSVPIQPPPPPPSSPTPYRPFSGAASIAPFKLIDPPVSGLPSTNFTSDTFLHGRRGSVSSVSWEDAPSPRGNQRIALTPRTEDTSSDASLNRKLVVMNLEDEHLFRSSNGRPPNLFFAELCQRHSSILHPPAMSHFPSSVGSFKESVRTDSRLADAPEQ